VEETARLVSASISRKVVLNLRTEENVPRILADPSQVRQVFMNLIINSSEAIGDSSGVITVCTGAKRCDAASLRRMELGDTLAEGLYVQVEVTDTGCGMDERTRARIFEPFFTTKFKGRGLGLAAVVGIVRSHRGALRISSSPGKGTTFEVLFPALQDSDQGGRIEKEGTTAGRWSGKILLVDDEESLRALGSRMLERLGFTVLTAADGEEGLGVYKREWGRIDLVILDLTMPRLDGADTLSAMLGVNPAARIVMASGHSEEDVAGRFTDRGIAGILQKPYTLSKLRELLGRVLGAPPGAN
jgi:CheY-like chemotaxis protein